MKNEEGEYKLMPPNILNRKKSDFYCWSPEQYECLNFKIAYQQPNINLFKAEIYTLGMLLIEIGTFQDPQDLYNKFDMKSKRSILDDRIIQYKPDLFNG